MASTDGGSNVNTDASEGGSRKELKWGLSLDLDYIRSIHGILMVAITVLSLIALICVSDGRTDLICQAQYGTAGYSFFGFVSGSAFFTGLFNYLLYIFTFTDKVFFKFVPWPAWDLLWCGVWGFFYLVGSSVVAAQACGRAGNIAATIFGFVVLGCFIAKGFMAFRRVREERLAAAGHGPQSSSSPPEYSAEKNFEQY